MSRSRSRKRLQAAARAQAQGALTEALGHAKQAVRGDPSSLEALTLLGNLLVQVGQTDEAERVLTDALRRSPGHPVLTFNLAAALMAGHHYARAEPLLRGILTQDPSHVPAAVNLAAALDRLGRPKQAAAFLELAALLAPDQAEIQYNLGHVKLRIGELDAAAAAWRAAARLDPGHARAWCNLGVVRHRLGDTDAAAEALWKAVSLDPALTAAWSGLMDLEAPGGEGAVAHRRRILERKPDLASARSSLLMSMQYLSGPGRDALFAEHRAFGRIHDRGASRPTAALDPDRRLVLGFVSGDFRSHAMRWFTLPLFTHRPDDVEIVLYHTTDRSDGGTAAFRQAADRWRSAARLRDEAMVQLIKDDGVDVLIDMSGHAPDNRLPLFAQRPAPLQIAWGDYVDTRGMTDIDAIIFDAHHIRPEEERWFTEAVDRMPHDYFCWTPPPDAPPVAPGPGGPVFGCFSEPTKIQPTTLDLWARVLTAVPESRFLFNGRYFRGPGPGFVADLAARGVDPSRVQVMEGGSHREFLDQYRYVDIILDTTPYSGGLTTCEALWMGVPVLTFPGDRVCGRHATAHLRACGLDDWVAKDPDDLVTRAAALANDPAALVRWRGALRDRVRRSPLLAHSAYARDFVSLIRKRWRRLCETGGATARFEHEAG